MAVPWMQLICIRVNRRMPNAKEPQRGEIWWVNFEPVLGSETNKTRPAAVVSGDAFGVLKVWLVIPLTGWKDHYDGKPWLVRVEATKGNGLQKESAADALAVRSVALVRFEKKLGHLSPLTLNEIAMAIAMVVEAI